MAARYTSSRSKGPDKTHKVECSLQAGPLPLRGGGCRERRRRGDSSSSGAVPPETASAPPPEPEPALDAAPAAAASSGKHKKNYDYDWEQRKLRQILLRRGILVKIKDTNERLIEKLAAHVSVNRAPLQAMLPQPALELASAAVRTTHELREECRKLGGCRVLNIGVRRAARRQASGSARS